MKILFILLFLSACSVIQDYNHPEEISDSALYCKTKECLKLAEDKILKAKNNLDKLIKTTKNVTLQETYRPFLEPDGYVTKYSFSNDKDSSAYEAKINKCLELSKTTNLKPHQFYCFKFSKDYLYECAEENYTFQYEDGCPCCGDAKVDLITSEH
jgi:hypothetical protein